MTANDIIRLYRHWVYLAESLVEKGSTNTGTIMTLEDGRRVIANMRYLDSDEGVQNGYK